MGQEKNIVCGKVYSDSYINGLEIVKSLLMTEPEETSITNDSSLDDVLHACAMVGLATLLQDMERDGSYIKHKAEVDLGNQVDDILNGLDTP